MDGDLAAAFAWRPQGGELTLHRRFRQPVEKLWPALTIPERLAAWMGVDWLGDATLQEGAAFSYRFRAMNIESHGRVLKFEAPFVLEHSWFDNRPPGAVVRWALERDGTGSLLTLTHSFREPDDAPRNASGWSDLLDGLAASLGEPVEATPFKTRRDHFAALFPPQATRDGRAITVDGAPALRFERHLPHAPGAVWAALVEPAALARWMQADALVDSHEGGRFHLQFRAFDHAVLGQITRWVPPALLEYTWPEAEAGANSLVRWKISEAPGGSVLVLTHFFRHAVELADFASGWHWHLDALDAALLGEARPFDKPRWAVLRQIYAATL
jgi:uncharacterized protein YndB with AHSA1/START domain